MSDAAPPGGVASTAGGRVPAARLARHHRGSQRQRQRQVPQCGSNLSRSSLIVLAGPHGQERRRLVDAEHIQRDGVAQIRGRRPVTGDQYPDPTAYRNIRPHGLKVGHVIKYQEALLPVGLQPEPHRGARVGDAPPGIAAGQSGGVSYRKQFGADYVALPGGGVDGLVAEVDAWREAGGTHVSVVTMGLGLDSADGHLDYLASVAGALRLP